VGDFIAHHHCCFSWFPLLCRQTSFPFHSESGKTPEDEEEITRERVCNQWIERGERRAKTAKQGAREIEERKEK
jgi:hypothetical protein